MLRWIKRLFKPYESPPDADQPRARPDQPVAPEPRARAARPQRTRVTPQRPEPDWRSYDWDDVAADYARVVAPMTAEPYADLVAMVGSVTPRTLILDVGTGTGDELAKVDAIVIGVDASAKMLAHGRGHSATARLAAAEAIDLPFADGSFEVVTANFVLPYFTKLDTALFDMVRVLAPGGSLAVSVWTDVVDDLTRLWRTLATERLGPELVRDAFKQGTPWAERVADAKHLDQTLRDAGLRPVEVHKRRYRNEMTRDDYVTAREVDVLGRYLHRMLGEQRWPAFRADARARFAEHFGEAVVDFRDVLLAVGRKPA